MQELTVLKDVVSRSEFFMIEDLDAAAPSVKQDIGAQEAATDAFDLPTEFFQYFQVEAQAS